MTAAATFAEYGEAVGALREELARVIIGYETAFEDLLIGITARGHILLEGVPGVAKTTLAKTFAAASGLQFRRLQFTQDLLPADVTGHYFYNQRTQEFDLRPGAVFTDLLLADEINRAPPKTQSALLEAMEERQVTIEGRTMQLPAAFMVVATMNPIDVEGVYRLPEAQLDRFIIRTRLNYLDPAREAEMLTTKLGVGAVPVKPVLKPEFFEQAYRLMQKVHVEPDVLTYLHQVCLSTRDDPGVVLGASPRAMEQLLRAVRARAVIEGRAYVIPDDIKALVPRVLNHRLILDVEAELAGRSAEAILADILGRVPVPKVASG